MRLTRTQVVWILLGAWLALFLWSVPAARATEATGEGFLRGINRAGVFFSWQLAALVPGAAAYAVSRALPRGWLRRLACVPLSLVAAFVLFILGLIVWSRLNMMLYAPEPYQAPVTAPAPELTPTE